MGFNWFMGGIAWLGLLLIWVLPIDVLLRFSFLFIFTALLILPSRVARHNIVQLFKPDSHQWTGDGPTCQRCSGRGVKGGG